MNINLLLFAACSIAVPVTATGQELTSVPSATDSRTIAYARTKANRVGIDTDERARVHPGIRNDSTGSGVHVVDHIRHAVIGGFFGTLGGALIGGVSGAWIDAHPTDDAMFSATVILGIYGAIAGLAVGLITGAVWPVK